MQPLYKTGSSEILGFYVFSLSLKEETRKKKKNLSTYNSAKNLIQAILNSIIIAKHNPLDGYKP